MGRLQPTDFCPQLQLGVIDGLPVQAAGFSRASRSCVCREAGSLSATVGAKGLRMNELHVSYGWYGHLANSARDSVKQISDRIGAPPTFWVVRASRPSGCGRDARTTHAGILTGETPTLSRIL